MIAARVVLVSMIAILMIAFLRCSVQIFWPISLLRIFDAIR
jgi:hypothetical protein